MRPRRPRTVTAAAVTTGAIQRAVQLLVPIVGRGYTKGRGGTGGCRLHIRCARRGWPGRGRRFMDAEKVGHLVDHGCLLT